jgi:hypothetical protein
MRRSMNSFAMLKLSASTILYRRSIEYSLWPLIRPTRKALIQTLSEPLPHRDEENGPTVLRCAFSSEIEYPAGFIGLGRQPLKQEGRTMEVGSPRLA